MMNIYTGQGDKGRTFFSGVILDKDSLFLEALGTLDELVSLLGLVNSFVSIALLRKNISLLQNKIFKMQAGIANSEKAQIISSKEIQEIEKIIDRLYKQNGRVEHFIVPQGSKGSCFLHFARTVCRRAERRLVALSRIQALPKGYLAFINRLSDFLFVAALICNKRAKIKEIPPSY